MISLNLLPDIKKEYLRAQRRKHLIITGSFLITVTSVTVVVLMLIYVLGVQKLKIHNSQASIDESILTLTETPDLAKIVTIQNQLSALPNLHDSKTSAVRLFEFLKVLTPENVKLSSVVVNFASNSLEIKGTGKDFKSVNTFVDTLKNASYIYADHKDATMAFNSVVLDTIGKSRETTGFKITFSYDPIIFDNTVEGLVMSVPNITSTRSETEKPSSLFDDTTEEKEK